MGDVECHAVFWSLAPLRNYEFFCKAFLKLEPPLEEGEPPRPPQADLPAFGVTVMALVENQDEYMYVGTDHGMVACVDIRRVVNAALTLQEEVRGQAAGQRQIEM